jgi:hypothetical protein
VVSRREILQRPMDPLPAGSIDECGAGQLEAIAIMAGTLDTMGKFAAIGLDPLRIAR